MDRFPTARQIAYGKKIDVDVSLCRTSREATRILTHRYVVLLIEKTRAMGFVKGVMVERGTKGRPSWKRGVIRYVKEVSPDKLLTETSIVGVDWLEPRRHFSLVSPIMLRKVEESLGDKKD